VNPPDDRGQPFTPEPPFRWDVKKREQLGSLLDGWSPDISDTNVSELIVCCARVIALSDDGELFFVGRSPDNLFDLLSGVFAGTSWEERIRQLPVSLKWDGDVSAQAHLRAPLRRYLTSLELSPEQINSRSRPTVLVDIVAEGRTYGELVRTWQSWAKEAGVSWAQMRRKLRLIGLTQRSKTSPKTWRWHQHVAWPTMLPTRSIKNVSVDGVVWNRLAESPKATNSFTPYVWFNPPRAEPSRHPYTIQGLREAAYWYESGYSATIRERIAAEMTRTPCVRSPWLRALAHELRAHPGESQGFALVPDDAAPFVRLKREARRAMLLRSVVRRNLAASLARARALRNSASR
jgi:hypothetical protein